MIFDFELLDIHDLEEELSVRQIQVRGDDGIKSLNDQVIKERAAVLPKPLPLPSIRLNNELNNCREKLALMEAGFAEWDGVDPTDKAAIQVRLWHLEGKTERLLSAFPGADAVSTLYTEITRFTNQTHRQLSDEGANALVPVTTVINVQIPPSSTNLAIVDSHHRIAVRMC